MLLLGLLVSACGPASLLDFRDSSLALELASDGRVHLQLGDASGACPTLGDARATLNGMAMAVDSRGGERPTAGGWICEGPSFSIDGKAISGVDASARIEDRSAVVALSARNVFADRTLSRVLASPASRTWTFGWQPATDKISRASWRADVGTTSSFGEALIADQAVSLEIPAGAKTLRVEGQAWAEVTECQAVASCTALVRATTGELPLSGEVF